MGTRCINSDKTVGYNDFSYHFEKIIDRFKKIIFNVDVLRKAACLVANPVKVKGFANLFDCTTVGLASD